MQVRPARSWRFNRFTARSATTILIGMLCFAGLVVASTLSCATEGGFGIRPVSASPPPALPDLRSAFELDRDPDTGFAKDASSAWVVTEGVIRPGGTLVASFREQGVDASVAELIARELKPLFDFRRAQPGHRYRLVQTPEGEVVDFRYRTSPLDSVRLLPKDGRYRVHREEPLLISRPARIAGVISSSLRDAVLELGEDEQLADDFAEVFAWDLDFARSAHIGDEFRIFYERLYYRDADSREIYLHPGRILAARFSGSTGQHTAFYFETEEGRGGYYRPDGSSVRREFLVAPLKLRRIASSYTPARQHPILKITRPHLGIDYAAPRGTPLWAVADGEVVFQGPAGSSGNLLQVRHVNGFISHYAHLERFAKSLQVGDTVRQKQVVGYVGDTGLATGPHVCFRVSKDGEYVNPMHLRIPSGDEVPEATRDRFYAVRDTLVSQLDGTFLVAN